MVVDLDKFLLQGVGSKVLALTLMLPHPSRLLPRSDLRGHHHLGMVVAAVTMFNIIISLNLNSLTHRKSISGVDRLTTGVEATITAMATAMAVDIVIIGVGVRAHASVPMPVCRRHSTKAGSTTIITLRW
jgi:hypothetical protein